MTDPSPRQLARWARRRWIEAPAPGQEWPTDAMRTARLMARLIAAGLTPAKAAETAQRHLLLGYPVELGAGLVLSIDLEGR